MLLFERSFGELSVKEILEASAEARDVEADDFALRLAEGAEVRFEELDDLITKNARNWSTERISRVALAIMRLAIYEMQYEENIPVSVSINEAVELAKKYGGDEDASFINGVLGGVARSVEAGDVQ